jgi:hypothetical protein
LADVSVTGASAYALALDGTVHLVDITTPHDPRTAASAPAPRLATDEGGVPIGTAGGRIAAAGDVAVVAHPARGLMVYVASDRPGPPATPIVDPPPPVLLPYVARGASASPARHTLVRAGTFDPFNSIPLGFAVSGDVAYVGMESGSLTWLAVVDMTRPAAPVLLGETGPLGCRANRVVERAGLVFLACGEPGLQVVDARNPVAPVLMGSLHTQAHLVNIALAENGRFAIGLEALAGSGSTQLVTYDVTDPAHPSESGRVALTGGNLVPWLSVVADRALVSGAGTGILTFDVSDPAAPTAPTGMGRALSGVGEVAVPRASSSSSKSGVFAAVNRGSEALGGGLWVLAMIPDLPEVGSLVSIDWPDVQGARQVSWHADLVAAASEDDLMLLDVTHPGWPRLADEMRDEFRDVHELLLTEGRVYLTDPDDGLVVIDVVADR